MIPKVSVIIPCYNQAHFLPDAIASLQAQELQNWECVIVNDGSTDATEAISKELSSEDKRIRYSEKKNGGLGSARNRGLELVQGEFIQFLDADDRLAPGKFSASFQQEPGADIILTDFRFFTNSEPCILPPFQLGSIAIDFNSILMGWDERFVIPIHCGLFRKELFSDLRFSEELKAREDWVMWLQLFSNSLLQATFVNQPLAFYRLSSSGMSQDKAVMNQALLQAFKLVYPIVPEDTRTDFFNHVLVKLETMLAKAEQELNNTKGSHSFRLGNFLVRNLNRVSPNRLK